MILKQQKVIRHLLQKRGAEIDQEFLEKLVGNINDCWVDTSDVLLSGPSIPIPKLEYTGSSSGNGVNDSADTTSRKKRLIQQNWSSIKSDPDFQAATDSDSAIMLEDHVAEV